MASSLTFHNIVNSGEKLILIAAGPGAISKLLVQAECKVDVIITTLYCLVCFFVLSLKKESISVWHRLKLFSSFVSFHSSFLAQGVGGMDGHPGPKGNIVSKD